MTILSRRRFLAGTGVTTAGLLALRGASPVSLPSDGAQEKLAAAATPVDRWAAVREQFVLSPAWVHMASFFMVSHPKPVREAIAGYRDELDADPFQAAEHGNEGPEPVNRKLRVKRAAAAYLGGNAEDVALTQSTTMGLSTVYHGLPLRAGDEVLLTTHDHYSHQESARLACERSGAKLRKIPLYDRFEDLPGISSEVIVERIRRAITPATRVVGMTWVHSSSGLRLPLRAISSVIREANSGRDERDRMIFVVDGVHGFGALDETVTETGCDVFIAGTHKWIFAPRGTGLIWARPNVWAQMRPLIPTFDGQEPWDVWLGKIPRANLPRADWFTAGGLHAYEHEWAVADAFEFHNSIGRKAIADRIHELNRQIKDGLAKIPRVKLWTPTSNALSAGIVGFDIEGLEPKAVVARLLGRKIIASESPYARPVARLAAGIMNTPEDVEKALAAVQAIAEA